MEAVRRLDAAAERSWQDRLEHRLSGCRSIVARLAREGTLRPGMPEGVTADLLCTLTSLRMWEDLALERGWTATLYEESISQLAVSAVTAEEFRASSSPSHSLMTAPESIE